MPAKISDETMAKVLAEAEIFGDEAVAKRWGIAPRTICYYRKRATTDAAFASICREYRQMLNLAWAENATFFINKIMAELVNRALTIENDSFSYTAIANSLKIVGELKIDWELLSTTDTHH